MNYMTAIALDSETRNYWEQIKCASSKAKLTLITLLSASTADEDKVVATRATLPVIARRLNTMTDEEKELEMQGEPVPLTTEDETSLYDIVEANSGRIAKGLEKWL